MSSLEFKLPDLGEGVTEGEIVKVHVKEGDKIELDQVLIEVMTDKASMEVPSTVEARVKSVKVKQGDTVAVGQTLLIMEGGSLPKQEQSEDTSSPAVENTQNTVQVDTNKQGLALPSTRKLAKEFGLDVATLSKEVGEPVTRQKVVDYIKNSRQAADTPGLPARNKQEKREKLKGIKKAMFESMTYSKKTIPHFTIIEKARVSQLVKLRQDMKQNSEVQAQGIKLTYLAFIMKAAVAVLENWPIFNSYYDNETSELVYRNSKNLGFAVDSPDGLVVPVIKQSENKTILQIASELSSLSEKVRNQTIKREELQDAGFTFTNLGSLGGLAGTPIIPAPQVAILGIYRMYTSWEKQLENLEEVPYMNFSLTCDHRIIDGATACRFLKSFVARIEEPGLLILD